MCSKGYLKFKLVLSLVLIIIFGLFLKYFRKQQKKKTKILYDLHMYVLVMNHANDSNLFQHTKYTPEKIYL